VRDLGVHLPPRERAPRVNARTREIFFFVVSFFATFLGVMLLLNMVR
jgi:hypothetical protein